MKGGNKSKQIYIADLIAAINWGTGIGISVRQIADAVSAMVGRPELVAKVSPPEIDPLRYVVADNARLKTLEWQHQIGLDRVC